MQRKFIPVYLFDVPKTCGENIVIHRQSKEIPTSIEQLIKVVLDNERLPKAL